MCVRLHAITMPICIVLIIIKGIVTIKFLWQQFTPRASLSPPPCFMPEKEGCGRGEMTHFQLLLSSRRKHNRFQEQKRNVKGKSKRNHSLKTNGR